MKIIVELVINVPGDVPLKEFLQRGVMGLRSTDDPSDALLESLENCCVGSPVRVGAPSGLTRTAIEETAGYNVAQAAKKLGVARSTLREARKRYGL